MGYIVSRSIMAITEAGIPDLLHDGPRSVPDLATAAGVDADALRRMLGLLESEGLLTGVAPDRVELTGRGRLLCSDTPGSLKHLCALMDHEAYTCWSGAGHALRTGGAAFDQVYGQPYFDWLAGHPDDATRFHAAQAGLVEMRLLPLLALDWSATRTVVDVGAGDGVLLHTLLTAQPHLAGIGFDLPEVTAAAPVGERTTRVGGSFFDGVPVGGDTYVLAQILHDWPDVDAVRILRRVREAMLRTGSPAARLLVLEQVVPDDTRPHPARLLDLHMLVLLGGRERTERQWRELLSRSGFRVERITAGARSALLEAVPEPD
ncbi:methyltransferase [Nakamurella sp. YIM 132087]|uniref:Methyltransferase n=2 Tax=Nakamurella alba TaxID=2665158 RepID=A0A7K1FNB9_9ACTN|nr:methyltransferase [Nakamurella alba]